MHMIEENMAKQTRVVPRSAVLHARAAYDGHRARLRSHHQRYRRGDDWLVRLCDALLSVSIRGLIETFRPKVHLSAQFI